MGKIFRQPEELLREVRERRGRGQQFAFANGCFDLIHVGHVRYLAAARELADGLICAVNSDDSMRRVKEGREPVYPEAERYEILAALSCVDYVIPIVEDTPISLIELLRPEVHCKGTDYTVDQLPEREAVQSYGGEIHFVGGPKVRNTSEILEELREPGE